jgi:hypothetical protein
VHMRRGPSGRLVPRLVHPRFFRDGDPAPAKSSS